MSLLDFLGKKERDQEPLPEEVLHIEQWGRDITLRALTPQERNEFKARLVAMHLVEGGVRTFANAHREEILNKFPAVLDKLFAAALKLSGFNVDDE